MYEIFIYRTILTREEKIGNSRLETRLLDDTDYIDKTPILLELRIPLESKVDFNKTELTRNCSPKRIPTGKVRLGLFHSMFLFNECSK